MPIPELLENFRDRLPILNERDGVARSGLFRKSWILAFKRLGLRLYTAQELRKLWATITLTKGASLHETSRRLGHREINITANTYGHLTQDGRERCRQIMVSAYGPYSTTAEATAGPGRADFVLTSR